MKRMQHLSPGNLGRSLLIALAPALPVAACSAADDSAAVATASSELTTEFPIVLRARGQSCDNRLFTGSGDWYVGECKTECAGVMTGVASTPPTLHCTGNSSNQMEWTDTVACDRGGIGVDLSRGRLVTFGASSQGGTFVAPHLSFDWAPGMAKAECGIDEAVTGIATDHSITQEGCSIWCGLFLTCIPGGAYRTMGVRCSKLTAPSPYTPSSESCTVMDFSFSDARESTATGDWDVGYYKGECGPGRFVGGIARASIGGVPGRAAKILCCSPKSFPIIH